MIEAATHVAALVAAKAAVIATTRHPSFLLEAPATRIVATDYLVSFETNRYSVPFGLIGQPVQVQRVGGDVVIRHRGTMVATHPVAAGKYQLHMRPEYGPGAISRLARQRSSTPAPPTPWTPPPEVEVRNPAWYDQLAAGGAA